MATTAALILGLLACAGAQNFADYDYQDTLADQQQQYRPAPARPSGPPRATFGQGRLAPTTTTRAPPVAILKQVNRHNDDGSYTYGYEAEDGSFKIETKLVDGQVMGKYGYVDETGKLRTVEYGANRYGFQPSGDGITVPPPTLVDETTRKGPNGEIIQAEEEGTYFEPEPARPVSRPKATRPRPQPQPAPQPQYYDNSFAAPPAPRPRPQPQYNDNSFAAPRPRPQPQYNENSYTAPAARPRPQTSSAPVPARAVIPGAAPVPRAAPQSFNVAPQQQAPRSQPAPVRELIQTYDNNNHHGVLDQLQQQFALPRSGTPLHDISFGSYSSQTNF